MLEGGQPGGPSTRTGCWIITYCRTGCQADGRDLALSSSRTDQNQHHLATDVRKCVSLRGKTARGRGKKKCRNSIVGGASSYNLYMQFCLHYSKSDESSRTLEPSAPKHPFTGSCCVSHAFESPSQMGQSRTVGFSVVRGYALSLVMSV